MAGRLDLRRPDPRAVTIAELVAASSGGGTPHPRTPASREASAAGIHGQERFQCRWHP